MKEKITNEEFEQLIDQVWLDFLNNATPIEIHQSVIDCNWDDNKLLLNWIRNNPNIDKATILIAYWLSGPRWIKQYIDREAAVKARASVYNYDFVEEVEQKYLQNFWTESNIELDPKCDTEGYDWTSQYLDKVFVREIPGLMFQKLDGQKVERPENSIEGLPTSPINYWQRTEDLFDKYDF